MPLRYAVIYLTMLFYLPANTAADESVRGTIRADEFHLHYVIDGDGMPGIVVGSSIYLPRAFSRNLRQHMRLVFIDHRGYAPSPGPMDVEAFTEDKILGDIERARRQLGLGRITIVGHSIHGVMALEYAKKYPENVSHVVMIASPPTPFSANGQVIDQYWEQVATPERKAILDENRRRLPDEQLAQLPLGERFIRTYLRNTPRIWFNPRFDATAIWEGVMSNNDFARARPFRAGDITQGLDSLDIPVFLALGRYDFLVPPPIWDRVKRHFRDLTIKEFENSGHWPHYEEAAAFDTALLDWMSERRLPSE